MNFDQAEKREYLDSLKSRESGERTIIFYQLNKGNFIFQDDIFIH